VSGSSLLPKSWLSHTKEMCIILLLSLLSLSLHNSIDPSPDTKCRKKTEEKTAVKMAVGTTGLSICTLLLRESTVQLIHHRQMLWLHKIRLCSKSSSSSSSSSSIELSVRETWTSWRRPMTTDCSWTPSRWRDIDTDCQTEAAWSLADNSQTSP